MEVIGTTEFNDLDKSVNTVGNVRYVQSCSIFSLKLISLWKYVFK